MPDEDKNVDQPPEPFRSILGEVDIFNPENRRIRCLGCFVSAGGGGIVMMLKNWQTLNHRAVPQAEKLGFLGDVITAREQLSDLTADVSKEDALWISLLCQHSRVYWPGDESEVGLGA